MMQMVYDAVPGSTRFNTVSKMMDGKDYLLIDNAYPYDLDPSIRHMVLFVKPSEFERVNAEIILRDMLPGKDFVYCVNSSRNISLPEIPHYQVFVRE
jgi:hypothetical protein